MSTMRLDGSRPETLKNRFTRCYSVAALVALLGLVSWAQAAVQRVDFPLSIDYPLLRSLATRQAYPDAGNTAIIVDEYDGCIHAVASDPQFSAEDDRVRFETHIKIDAGTPLGGKCLLPIRWEGYLVLRQQPRIDPQTWQLSFETIDSAVYNNQRQPARVAGILWKLIETNVLDYLSQIRIDLTPPVSDLKAFLLPLFSKEFQESARDMLESMRAGGVAAGPGALRVEVLAAIEAPAPEETTAAEPHLTSGQREHLILTWETWDALLVEMVAALAGEPLTDEDRALLLDVTLETRHSFVDALDNDTLTESFIRAQFIQAWQQISPLFRAHLVDEPSDNMLGYLAFFTASDALIALDKIGPSMGIEISRDGFIRLARMLNQEAGGTLLPEQVNARFRQTLGFDPLEAIETPIPPDQEIEMPPEQGVPAPPGDNHSGMLPHLFIKPGWFAGAAWFVQPVHAASSAAIPSLKELRRWLVPDNGLDRYMRRVKDVLVAAADRTIAKGDMAVAYHGFFRQLTLATAWQESCFRQFRVKKNKLTYLRSYNGSSVGIMQINERVWRGIYDLNQLRWDITYNARAGCEILNKYLHRYALRRRDRIPSLNKEVLAQLVYAMYNGGPAEFDRFLGRRKAGKPYLSDRLFAQKYAWVKGDHWEEISACHPSG